MLKNVNTPCVVVASGGCWGGLLSFLRSLGSRGVPVYLIGVGCDLAVAQASRYCAGFVRLPLNEEEEVAGDLLAWRRNMGWSNNPVLFCLSERLGRMFCSQREVLEEGFVVSMPEAKVLAPLLRKDSGLAIAHSAGLKAPQSWTVMSVNDLATVVDTVELPAIIKPLGADTLGRVSYKADIVTVRGELESLGKMYLSGRSKFVVQQYIPGGDGNLWAYLFYKSRYTGALYHWTGRKLRQSPASAGIMALGESRYAPHVAKAGQRFVEAAGYWGLGGVEFKEYQNELYFIEMNPRAEAIQSMAIADGIDLPALAYAEATGQGMPQPKPQMSISRYVDGEACLGNLANSSERLGQGMEVLGQLFRKNVVCPVWSRDDPKPFLRSVILTVMQRFKRMISAKAR